MAKATTVEAFLVRTYLPPGTQLDDHDCFSLISLNPAAANLSLTDLTAWKGVGELWTKVRKSFAAVLVVIGPIVEYDRRVAVAANNRMSMKELKRRMDERLLAFR
jgi:hypothetical protein